jgi:hypothetical protein
MPLDEPLEYDDTTPAEIREQLSESNPDALYADGFDEALVGIARRCGQPDLAVYSVRRCIEVLMQRGMTEEEADEFFDFNVVGAWVGPMTPIFLSPG